MEKINFNQRPRICCIDLKKETIETFKKKGVNIYEGTLGPKVRFPNQENHKTYFHLLKYDFPDNLHEFDIIILDLNESKTIDYKVEDNLRSANSEKTESFFTSKYPVTVFDPRPFSSYILGEELYQITNKNCLIIIFATKSYEIDYVVEEIGSDKYNTQQYHSNHNIYSFSNHIPLNISKAGEEIHICDIRSDVKQLFENYKNGMVYNQTFYQKNNKKFLPLLKNSSGEIVSYIETIDNFTFLVLPQIEAKTNFLIDFLDNLAPSLLPELFPHSTKFLWKEQKDYWLPNHEAILSKKASIKTEYDNKLKEVEREIERNKQEFSFLHAILTETSDKLVKAVIKFMKWLEFTHVIAFDEKNDSTVLEEDIQIELEGGLLIIECKGIGGTSTDSDCSQISKVRRRREKERGKHDVKALYIVNHQKHLPPIDRKNPPFSSHQIEDAVNDERGLVTTFQLFNLYFDIENEIITKNEARNQLLNYGLVEFKPENLIYIDEPTEFYKDNMVCIVNIDNINLEVNDEIFIEKNGRFEKVKIEEIKENDKNVKQVVKGAIGLKLSKKIKDKSKLWKRKL